MTKNKPNCKNNNSWRKCINCGKYLSYRQLQSRKDVQHFYIPETEYTKEESYWSHRKCGNKIES